MTDSRRERALTAARIRLRSPVPRPLLDETRIDEVCAELLAFEEREKAQAEYSEAYLDWMERGGKQPLGPQPLCATWCPAHGTNGCAHEGSGKCVGSVCHDYGSQP